MQKVSINVVSIRSEKPDYKFYVWAIKFQYRWAKTRIFADSLIKAPVRQACSDSDWLL